MNDFTPPPVEVPASATGAQTSSAIRDILKILGAALVSKGLIESSWVEPLVGAVMVLGPVLWSQASVLRKHALTVMLAHSVSDKVAKVVE